MEMKNIQIGDYWKLKGGVVFKVTQLPTSANKSYVGNRVSPQGGLLKGVGYPEEHFEERIDHDRAKWIAKQIMEQVIDRFFA